MKDHELDRLIARVNPYGDRTVAQLPTGGAEADLLEELMTSVTPTLTPGGDPGQPLRPIGDPGRPRRRSRRFVPVAAAAATALIALTGVVAPRLGGPDTRPADAAGAPGEVTTGGGPVASNEVTERLLLDDPGWKVHNVTDFGSPSASVRFKNGTREVELSWAPASAHAGRLKDRGFVDDTPEEIGVLGRTGSLFRYTSGKEFRTILPPRGAAFLEIRGLVGSEQEYRDLLGKLRAASMDEWLAALPQSTVSAAQEPAVIRQMLAGVPLPAGLDPKTLRTGTTTSRYQIGAKAGMALACGWITQWAAASRSGDQEKARQALAAFRSARSWKFLKDINAGGDTPEFVWMLVSEVESGKIVPGTTAGPGQLTVEAAVAC